MRGVVANSSKCSHPIYSTHVLTRSVRNCRLSTLYCARRSRATSPPESGLYFIRWRRTGSFLTAPCPHSGSPFWRAPLAAACVWASSRLLGLSKTNLFNGWPITGRWAHLYETALRPFCQSGVCGAALSPSLRKTLSPTGPVYQPAQQWGEPNNRTVLLGTPTSRTPRFASQGGNPLHLATGQVNTFPSKQRSHFKVSGHPVGLAR